MTSAAGHDGLDPVDDPRKLLLQEHQAGALIYAERLRPPTKALIIGSILVALVGLLGLTGGWQGWAATTAGAGLILGLIFAGGSLDKHRVHENALLVGPTVPGWRAYVIPIASIDPACVRLERRSNFIRPANGQLTHSTNRQAPWSTQAISFPGLTAPLAHPLRRIRATYDFTPGLPATQALPTERWVLATRHPEQLLQALETALIRHGRQKATGLTQHQLANPHINRWQRHLTP